MIQLDKQLSVETDITGQVVYKTQAVLLPNSFFLNPNIKMDWVNNTCELDGDIYYLDKSALKTSTQSAIPSKEEWMNTYGNYIKTELYDFIDNKNNPSNNHQNIYRMKYFDSKDMLKYIIEYAWDQNDNNVSIRSLAPEGAEAQKEKVFVVLRLFNGDLMISTEKYEKGSVAFIKSLSTTEKNKTFYGWMHKGNPLPINAEGVSEIVMNDNEEISAIWLTIYTLKLIDNEQTISTETYAEDTVVQLPSLDDTDANYFVGWKAEGEHESVRTISMIEDTTLYSVYLPWISIEITSTDGQTLSYHNGKVRLNEVITLDDLNALLLVQEYNQDGNTYTFEGWYIGDIKIEDDVTIENDELIEITAKWNVKPFVTVEEDATLS